MQNKLPQFEANQVLSNVHLNQFVEYLEEQGRLTRNHLLGAGIVSGLDIKRSSSTNISIYEGVGVSSAGYLIVPDVGTAPTIDAAGRKFITYNRKRKFEPKNLLSPYTGDFDTLANGYSLFNGTNAATIFSLIEMTAPATTDVNVSSLTAGDLNDHVLILFLEIKVKELKNCEGEDCIDLGKEINYNVIPLLVSKPDVDIIKKNESDKASSLDGTEAIRLAWQMIDLSMPKPDLTAIDGDSIREELAFVYAKAIEQLKTKLKDASNKIDSSLQQILNNSEAPIANFLEKLTSITEKKPVEKAPGIYQYVYDFACDFLAAYRELQDAVAEFASYEMPSRDSFPCHIRLGDVPAVNGVTSSFDFPPSSYRHSFVDTRNVERQRKVFYTLQVLTARLQRMIDNLEIDQENDDIRITPSIEPGQSISERAIPFYYAADGAKRSAVLPVWNAEWNRQGKQNRILNYFTNANRPTKDKFRDGHDITKDDPSFFPLMYNQDRCNFYRVEGYLGQQIGDVFEELKTYIAQYNLPFDLQLVGLNRASQLVIKEMRLRFNDLDSMYNVMCEEVLCLLTTELNYFKNIRLTRRIFTATPVLENESFSAVEDKEDTVTKVKFPLEETFFFKSERQKPTMMTKSFIKTVQTINLGVKDSTADITERLGTRVPIKDLGNIIGAGGIRFIPTPASPYILKLISAIEKLISTLKEDFDDFDNDDYKNCLNQMHSETKEFITFLKPQSAESLALNSNLDKDESLGYLERLLYECDFEKIPAIDEERDKREKQLGYNNNLSQYLLQNPGLEHKAGVWKGGTFVVVFDRGLRVIADFCLPYKCCGGMNTTQYVLGVIQTLWFDGQVLDKDGAPVEKPKVTLNGEELVVDKNGRFRKIIPPNTFLVLKVTADGFEPTEISITSANDNVSQTVTLLKKAEIPKVALTITLVDSANSPIKDADVKTDDGAGKTNNAGQVTLQVRANANISLTISKQGYITKNDTITTQALALQLNYKLVKVVKLTGSIVDFNNQPVNNAKVFVDDKVITVTGNKFETNLEDSRTYRLVVDVAGLQKFTEDVQTLFDDINKPIKLQQIKTFTVRVGIYKSVEPERQPTQPTPTAPGGIRFRERATAGTGVFRIGGAAASSSIRRALEFDTGRLFTDAGRGGGTTTPPPDKFSLMNNNSASSSIADRMQGFNQNLRLFESQEKVDRHKLLVKDMLESMEFGSLLNVTDHDLLVLIHSVKGKQFEKQFSIIISNATGANMIGRFNEIMSSAMGLGATQPLATGDTIELRMFTQSDLEEIKRVLNKNNIIIAQEKEIS